jgi:exodeoxyribonuclease-5
MARNGQYIPFGQYDDHVAKLAKHQVTPLQMLRGGQLICGKNATRFQLNNDMRCAAGLANGFLPSGPNEKIICLKNQNDLGLINGMFLTLDDIEDEDECFFSAVIRDDEGEAVGKVKRGGNASRFPIYKGHFLDHVAFDKDRHDRDWKAKKSLIEATFGWAITCHKAQGSQWENVIVWDDGLGRTEEDRARWLYTAITRAEKGLVLLG